MSTLYVNNNEEVRKILYENAKRGRWELVVEKYEEYPKAQELKLTQQGDTALHLAVIDNQEKIVEMLVKLICRSTDNYKELLETTNDKGNNPLHLAAVMGRVRMCHTIASAHEELVDMRNEANETSLFLAAMYGNKDAFYCLYYYGRSNLCRIASNCRGKNNGDTVLHCALRNEHFDLAFQLIHWHPEAVNWVSEEGLTPLHVLASMPTSFKSGSQIWGWHNIIYYCTFVDQLKPQTIETLGKACIETMCKANTAASYFPDNYETCIDFFTKLWGGFLKVSTFNRKKNDEAKNDTDLENDVHVEGENVYIHESHESVDTHQLEKSSIKKFPINYCIDFFKVAFSAIVIILGFGFPIIRMIRAKKEKHTWSVQVMEKLLEFAASYKYHEDGRIPLYSHSILEEATYPYRLVDGEVQFSKAIFSVIRTRTEGINIREKKQKHTWLEVMKKFIEFASLDKYGGDRRTLMDSSFNFVDDEVQKEIATESQMVLAVKNGVIEIVMGMFERFPVAINDTSISDRKNVVLLAAEHRQSEVYKFLLKNKYHIESMFRAMDNNGNSALHLAAARSAPKFWHINGAALQMQWEVEWYKLVKESMKFHSFLLYNKEGKTASIIFEETHMDLVQKAKDWLYSTSQSCSVVATLIATVAFATAATIPGGNDDHGDAALQKEKGFFIFAISSLIALSLSTTSVVMFLAILTARFDVEDYFGSMFPWKLFIGISSLYFSIIAMLISFCTGHYFLIHHRLQNMAVMLYTLTFLPVAFIFAIMHLPLYYDLMLVLLKIGPKRRVHVDPCDD